MNKFFFTIIACFTATTLVAQKDTVITYHDQTGKPVSKKEASRYTLQYKEKDHWKKSTFSIYDHKLASIEYFKDPGFTISDGTYQSFYKNQEIMTSGRYADNKKEGIWKTWSSEKKLIDSASYKNGFVVGLRLMWNPDGRVSDSLIFEENGKGIGRGYYDNGSLRQAGNFTAGQKNGLWAYYYRSGIKSQEVMYQADSAISFTCYDEQGKLVTKDCYYEKEASYKKGEIAWRKYLEKKLGSVRLPKAYYKGKISGTVVLQFVVSKDGKITDVKVITSVHPELDNIAANIVRESPDWEPAIQYNRKMNAYRLQPITFPPYE